MKYDWYISLGDHCTMTFVLNDNGLRKQSFPFDWIHSDIYQNMEIIKDLLEGRDDCIEKFTTAERKDTDTINGYGYTFPHETDPLLLKEKFTRRMKRLREVLKGGNVALFIVNRFDKIDIDRITKFCEWLNTKTTFHLYLYHGDESLRHPDKPMSDELIYSSKFSETYNVNEFVTTVYSYYNQNMKYDYDRWFLQPLIMYDVFSRVLSTEFTGNDKPSELSGDYDRYV